MLACDNGVNAIKPIDRGRGTGVVLGVLSDLCLHIPDGSRWGADCLAVLSNHRIGRLATSERLSVIRVSDSP